MLGPSVSAMVPNFMEMRTEGTSRTAKIVNRIILDKEWSERMRNTLMRANTSTTRNRARTLLYTTSTVLKFRWVSTQGMIL